MNYIKQFKEITADDVALVGGKSASLGEMIRYLATRGIAIPNGFAVTSNAYHRFLEANNLVQLINDRLAGLDKNNLTMLADCGAQIRSMICNASVPQDIIDEILVAYGDLEKEYGSKCDVAVRSSATAEDLPEASFAGQQDSFLNVVGAQDLLKAWVACCASLFNNRAISYRIDRGFDHAAVALSVAVQKMVRSDQASSGVIFTLDTESGCKKVVFITSAYGLGETVVQGVVNPDEFYVHKQTLRQGFKPLLKKRCGSKLTKMIYGDEESLKKTLYVDVPVQEQRLFSLTDDEILELARYALTIEDHYTKRHGAWVPMDIEWAKDYRDGKLYIIQARPETVHSTNQKNNSLITYALDALVGEKATVLATGKSVGKKIVTGVARCLASAKNMHEVCEGEIIVTDMTDPDWEPVMRKAAAIVTNRGGRTCHAAIVSREIGVPAIVGTGDALQKIRSGQVITIDCSSSDVGLVYDGAIPFTRHEVVVDNLAKPPVDILVNIANPDNAFATSLLPNNGVGLARLEFIINSSIGIHPMAFINPERVIDPKARALIDAATIGYADKKQYFVDKLAQEVGTIAAAFYPKPVIVRFSDFKSNEYAKLIGGDVFEPTEENPMLGFRGAVRYYHDEYRAGFELECAAIKKIRDSMGLINLIPMVPFVRTVAEGQAVVTEMARNGLVRGVNGLEIYMMCELPSNVLLIDAFAQIFDGFSIGSNDLTQLTLGVDRDSGFLQGFDERDEAVKIMIQKAIAGSHRNGKKIGICGQAPSDFPEFAQFLINEGIDSISLNPDSVIRVMMRLE